MASIETLPANAPFMIRIYKRHENNSERSWVNTYEFRNATPKSSAAEYVATVNALVDFERRLHGTTTVFTRAVLSTWVEDGTPYNPASFKVYELEDLPGLRILPGDELPLNYVLKIKRSVEYGRNGHAQYRNCLGESDVKSTAGTPIANSPSALETAIATALSASAIDGWIFGGGDAGEHYMAMVGGTSSAPVIRVVVDLVFGGIGITKYNHKYFNRF